MKNFKLPIKDVRGEISLFPGFEASLGISHSVYVPLKDCGKGLGTKAHAYRLGVAKYLGFKNLICTVRISNIAQIKILNKFGWKELHRLGTYCNTVILYLKDLSDVEPIAIEGYTPNFLREKELEREKTHQFV